MSVSKRTIVLGHPRSGTTLLRRLLAGHENIVAPPETHLFGACARFLSSEETADGVDMGVLAGLHFSGFDDEVVIGRLRDLAFGFMDEIATRDGASHWIEKTAFDIFHLDGIEALCDDQVRYLGIIRHPLDVAVSCTDFCSAAGLYPDTLHPYIVRYSQPIEAFVRSWIDSVEALMSLGERRPNQVMICRYEDLVAEPNETIADLLAFLGEPNDTAFLATALSGMDNLGFSDHKSYQVDEVHQSSIHRWSAIPTAQVGRLATLLNPYLELTGYDVLDETQALTAAEGRNRYARSLAVHAAQRNVAAPDTA